MDTAPEKFYTIDASTLSPQSPSSSGINKTISHNKTSTSSLVDTSSSLLCSCEKFLKEGNVYSKSTATSTNVQSVGNINIINTKLSSHRIPLSPNTGEKRLILTRNAATSPNLDLRKLSCMTTISASGSTIKSQKYLIEPKNSQNNGDAQKYKHTLEKSRSLSENKSIKLLRTTRSLSPRPQIQHQHAIIVSEASDDDEEINASRNSSLQYHRKNGRQCSPSLINMTNNYDQITLRHRKTQNTCRSEQCSPNISDNSYLKFEYSQLTNRSTDCLAYIPSDPWLQMTIANSGSSNIKRKPLFNTKPMSNILSENQIDPWIRRNDIPTTFKTTDQDSLRQKNALTVSKYLSRVNKTKNSTMLPVQATQEKCTSRITIDKPLQSAPASPHFPIISDNSFSSIYSLNNNSEIEDTRETRKYKGSNSEIPIRSSSFSPIQARNIYNPFLNYNSATDRNILSATPKISIANDSNTFNNCSKGTQFPNHLKSKSTAHDHNLLKASSSNLLQDRHSSSVLLITNNWRNEELQLNIRRLSDQIFRKSDCDIGVAPDVIQSNSNKNVWPNNIKSFYSDRNINDSYGDQWPGVVYDNCIKERNNGDNSTGNLNRADISKYLQLFRGNESKKVDKLLKNVCISNKISSPVKFNQIVNENRASESGDTLLETTC